MAAHHAWSAKSLNRLRTCHDDLQKLMNEVLLTYPLDITIIEGHRSEERQNQMVEEGKSKLNYPNSKHNGSPSRAVDVAPLRNGKIEWRDRELWAHFAGFVLATAQRMEIDIRWGGDWNSDLDFNEAFYDAPHFELR